MLTIGVVLLFVGVILIVAGALSGVGIPAALAQLGWLMIAVGLILIIVALVFVNTDAHAMAVLETGSRRSSWGLITAGGFHV